MLLNSDIYHRLDTNIRKQMEKTLIFVYIRNKSYIRSRSREQGYTKLIEVDVVANKSKTSYKGKSAKKNNLMLILFPIILVVLPGLIFVLNNQNEKIVQDEAANRVVDFKLEGQPVLGSSDAKVTLVEFGDYKCPACKQWEETIFPQLKADYIDKGDAQFVFMNYPFLGPDSNTAAYAGEAIHANHPDAFFAFHEALYAAQQDERVQWATPEYLLEVAKKVVPDLNGDEFLKQIQDDTYKEKVQGDFQAGEAAKVSGTPSVFVNGKEYTGNYLDYKSLKAFIDQELSNAK